MSERLTDQEFNALRARIGDRRRTEIHVTIAGFLNKDDEQGFYAWRVALPEDERTFVHECAERSKWVQSAQMLVTKPAPASERVVQTPQIPADDDVLGHYIDLVTFAAAHLEEPSDTTATCLRMALDNSRTTLKRHKVLERVYPDTAVRVAEAATTEDVAQ